MIGSPRFRLPGSLLAEDAAWGKNRAATLALAERLGIGPSGFRLDYFAGTMFWARRETLEPLKRLNLAPTDFPEERGQRDGELHHALERLFGALPALSGQRLENAPVHLADETLLPTTDAA
jgi:lipopolysaccharide biosynthesis protein